MNLKRFQRPTVREALAAARESLGPQALVLSTKLVAAPGWRGWTGQRVVSLTAAPDHEVPEQRTLVSADRQADDDIEGFERFSWVNRLIGSRSKDLAEVVRAAPD